MRKILSLIFFLFLFSGIVHAADFRFTVVIDPGHGGKDGGAVRGAYKEKHINLGVALALGRYIEDNFKDVKVVYTRKTDVFVDLDKRAQIANKAKANLFISIHTNSTAAKSTTATGTDTYILGLARSEETLAVAKRENSVILLEDDYTKKYEGFDPHSPESYIIFEFITNKFMEQSLQFATHIQKDFRNVAKRSDRGVRQAGFLVLRKTSMPSVLIELGFINNQNEGKFLASKSGQQSMSRAIYSGFVKYKRDFDKKQGIKTVASDNSPNEVFVSDIDTVVKDAEPKELQAVSSESKSVVSSNSRDKNNGEVEYRVQFLYSPVKLASSSSAFKGLSPVLSYKDGSGYKYTYGASKRMSEISKIQSQVRRKFKDAFIVKFVDGARVK